MIIVVGTITVGGGDFISAVKNRRDIEILEVNQGNRDALPGIILKKYPNSYLNLAALFALSYPIRIRPLTVPVLSFWEPLFSPSEIHPAVFIISGTFTP